jgi:acyl carrier protein
MDLEADLGIDSIKRVEILGSLEEKFPSLPAADTEVLAQTRTLQEIVDYMNSEPGDSNSASQPDEEIPSQPEENSASEEIQETQSSPTRNGSAPNVSDLTTILLDIVAEKTGYPAEMLEADMDMEADLGIDSIKRVEILGAMEERVPGLPAVEAEALAELRTLGQIVDEYKTNLSNRNFTDRNGRQKKS